MFLNSLDLCVCITTVLTQILRLNSQREGQWDVQNVSESLYVVFVEAAGFTTFLLSITRCLSVSLPMYNIRDLYVAISAVVFIGYVTVREITFWIILLSNGTYDLAAHAAFNVGGIGLMVVLVVLTNSISIRNILRERNIVESSRESGFQATVTVVILSALFCVLNTFYFVSAVLHFYFAYSGDKLDQNFAFKFGIFYAVPLNSALNPLIYFLRNSEMRLYIVDLSRIPIRRCQEQPHQDVGRRPVIASTVNVWV